LPIILGIYFELHDSNAMAMEQASMA